MVVYGSMDHNSDKWTEYSEWKTPICNFRNSPQHDDQAQLVVSA